VSNHLDTAGHTITTSFMATPGRLTTPPITEALVDIRIATTVAVDPKIIHPLKDLFHTRYPIVEDRRRFEARLEARLGEAPDVTARDAGFHGLFLRPHDRSRLVQFRLDGFTFNQLDGYTTAEPLIAEALEFWGAFNRAVAPVAVVRVALRYINRLHLRFRDGDPFERFLSAAPRMPDGVEQDVGTFLTRVVLPIRNPTDATAAVTQRLETPTADTTPYTLDIDVFKEGEFPTDNQALRALFLELRQVTDRFFFSFVTDEALEPHR
jgi:uncharacterized protein (TIGR04255 family)